MKANLLKRDFSRNYKFSLDLYELTDDEGNKTYRIRRCLVRREMNDDKVLKSLVFKRIYTAYMIFDEIMNAINGSTKEANIIETPLF